MRSIRTFCRLCKKVRITQGHSGEIPRERVESGVLKDMKGKNLGEQEKLRGCSLNPEPGYFKDKETLGQSVLGRLSNAFHGRDTCSVNTVDSFPEFLAALLSAVTHSIKFL